MELVGKVWDAATMLWLNLDDRERMLIVSAVAWIGVTVMAAARRRDQERFRQTILDELADAREG